MTITEYEEKLCQAGGYQTPDRPRRSLLDRLLGWTDFWYYTSIARVVFRGARQAKQGRYTPDVWADSSLSVLAAVEACGGRISITGFDKVKQLGAAPAVFIANHMSTLETFLTPAMLLTRNYAAIVIKEGLLTYPIFGHIMRAVDPISVTRDNPRDDLKAVLTQGKACLAQGRSVMIFPQATRTTQFDPAAFNSLGVKLAARAKVPAVPLALKTDFHGNGRRIKDMGRIDRRKPIHFAFGDPITTDIDAKTAQRTVVAFITSCLQRWEQEEKETP